MTTLLRTIWILVAVLLFEETCCQNGFNGRDMVGYKHMASNEGQIETITSYSTNIIQRDPSTQSLSSVNVQYHITDDKNKNVDYNKANSGRNKKNYRIKNPFHNNLEDEEKNGGNTDLLDSGTAASNQYAAMRYSLPPDEFLQKIKAENQYNQQQQQLVSTLAPNLEYTATPQPQYLLSSISTSNYDSNNILSNLFQRDPKISQAQTYISNLNYQYGPTNTYGLDVIQTTPAPVNSYISTPFPNQYLSTSVYPYFSSSTPFVLSSPSNLQPYASSPLTSIQANSPNYNNQITSTIGSDSQNIDNRDLNKNIQIDNYDNSGNGIKYTVSMYPQLQNNYPSSTLVPVSTPYSETVRDSGQNTLNTEVNALSKSLQELSLSQFQNYLYKNNQREIRTGNNEMNSNSETQRMGSLPAANNVYLNYVQPDYRVLNTLKSKSRDSQQNSNQQEIYSNGDYGWKLNDKTPLSNLNSYLNGNYPRYSGFPSQSDSGAVSQINFHMDTGKNYNSESKPRTNAENTLAQATMKPQESIKQQQHFYNNNYPSSFVEDSQQSQNIGGSAFYGDNEKKKNKYTDGSNPTIYTVSSSPLELITSPYYYGNNNNIILDNKPKPSFDHAKALQNIVPIDVSNVVPNTDYQSKSITVLEKDNRYNIGKDHLDENIKKYYRTLTDSIYKDKNTLYGFNIQTKPQDFLALDYLRPLELNAPNTAKQQQSYDQSYNNPNTFLSISQTHSYTPQGSSIYQDNIHSPIIFQQQQLPYPQNHIPSNIAAILKLNDTPHRLTQGLYGDSLRLHSSYFDQGGVPSPLPVRLNQNLGSHQLDVTSKILSKQPGEIINKPELDAISTINGYKVANPFNVDLRLVAEMLKSKPNIDETQMHALKDQLNKLSPIKFDLSQLQLLLRNENSGNLEPLSDSLSAYSNPYISIYGSRQYPYQGVKYSRSQEEEEESIIPIADTSNSHPIGAVVEQVDEETENEITIGSDITASVNENAETIFEDDRTKKSTISSNNSISNRHRHPNVLTGRHSYQSKHPLEEPHRLLKPPPPRLTRHRGNHMKVDNYSRQRRRRTNRPKVLKVFKPEPLYEDASDMEYVEPTIPILLRPPQIPNAENKSDKEQAS